MSTFWSGHGSVLPTPRSSPCPCLSRKPPGSPLTENLRPSCIVHGFIPLLLAIKEKNPYIFHSIQGSRGRGRQLLVDCIGSALLFSFFSPPGFLHRLMFRGLPALFVNFLSSRPMVGRYCKVPQCPLRGRPPPIFHIFGRRISFTPPLPEHQLGECAELTAWLCTP